MIAVTLNSGTDWLQRREAVLILKAISHDYDDGPNRNWQLLDRLRPAVTRRDRYLPEVLLGWSGRPS